MMFMGQTDDTDVVKEKRSRELCSRVSPSSESSALLREAISVFAQLNLANIFRPIFDY